MSGGELLEADIALSDAIRSIWAPRPDAEVVRSGGTGALNQTGPEATTARQGIFWIGTIPRHAWSIPESLPDALKWIKGQLERGESGFEHWQIIFAVRTKTSLTGVKKIFGITGAHFELTRSEKAEAYCWKDDTSIGSRFELGAKPIRVNEKTDWETVW